MTRDPPRPAADPAPERTLTHAERCRTLAVAARSGALSTIAREPLGFPYGSLVTVAVDARGRPLLFLSTLAEHTRNLAACADASILLAEPVALGGAPLAGARVTLLGACRAVPDDEIQEARAVFLAAHPDAAAYASFKDFGMHRLEPVALRYVGGFGRMSWVSAEDYLAAEPDPIAPHAAEVLAHMNGDHGDALLAYARGLAGVADAVEARMSVVDRRGFDLVIITPRGSSNARLAFDAPVSSTEEARRALVALARAARAALA